MKIIFVTILAFSALMCNAQPLARGGNTGIWIILSNTASRGSAYLIERSTDDRTWEQVARVLYPSSRAELDARILEINKPGMNLPEMPRTMQLDYLWRIMEKGAPADSFIPFAQNYGVCYAAGMAWFDETAPKYSTCRYRISRTDRSGRAVSNIGSVSAAWPGKGPETDYRLSSIQPLNNGNAFEFKAGPAAGVTHFKVFRSYHLRTAFEPIQASLLIRREDALLHLSIFDPTVTPEVLYAYYLVAYDAAGNPGNPSPEVRLFSVPENSIQPSVRGLRTTSDNKRRAVKLSWRPVNSNDVISVDIYKGFLYDGKYAKVISLPAGDTVYLDYDVEPVKTYYYTAVLNGTFESSPNSPRVSGMLEATDPNMLPPQMFRAELTESNRVKLSWVKLGEDTRGYHLYRSIAGSNAWNKVKESYTTDSAVVVIDSLPLTESNLRYAYFVTDLNTSYNESPASAVEIVFLPGTTALPVPEEVTASPLSDGSVRLFWTNTARLSAFVSGYHVYRNKLNAEGGYEGPWKQLNPTLLEEHVNMWTDMPTLPGRYVYIVRSAGADGTLGKASPEAVFTKTTEIKLNVSTASVFSSSEGATINWTSPIDPELKAVEIWKAETGKESRLVFSAPVNMVTYTDKDVKIGTGYLYTIRCSYSDGNFSGFTEAGTIHR